MIKTLFKYFKAHRGIFALDMLCAIIVAAIDLAFPLVSRKAMYDLLPGKLYRVFFALMITVALFFVIRSVAYYIMTYWGHTFGVRVEADIRADLFRHFQELDFDFYDRNRTGKLMSRLTGDLFEITELSHHGPEDLVISVLTILGALIFMFTIEWRLALIVTLIIPVFLIVVIMMRKRMTLASAGVKQNMASINADIESCISGIRTSKAFSNEEVDFARFGRSNDRYKVAKKDFYKAMGMFNATQEFFMCIMPVAVIAFGGKLIMEGAMNYIDLITFTLFVNTFIAPIRKLANFAEIFTNGMAGLKRFDELMKVEPKVKESENPVDFAVEKGDISLENVCFSYTEGTRVLTDISMDVKAGETIAVVGASGGGKTTLCQLIPRFYDVTSGSIKVDGVDIRDVRKRALRSSIGIVQQDVFIFADSIYENIRYGRPDADFDEVVEAAKKAEIYDDIMEMPDKFDTYVGERGTMLSGGQKQRISIARIFLKNPKILILDEATSALDTVTEKKIQKSFDELSVGRTTLVIAHRLATVRNADRIVLIEDGKIKEEGRHDELMALGGGYAKLYNTQKLGKKTEKDA